MSVNLYYTQNVRRGFQQKYVEYFEEKVIHELKRTQYGCPKSGSEGYFC